MYSIKKSPDGLISIYRPADKATIPSSLDNPDYIFAKSDILAGAKLLDANGAAMTAAQISSFLASIA